MTVKKTQQTLSTTLEKTEQALDGLENGLDAGRKTKDTAGTETSNPVGAHPVRDSGEGNAGLPEGWCDVTLSELVKESFTGLVRGAKDQDHSLEYLYLKMNNLSINGEFETDNLVRVSATQQEVDRFTLRRGDFIFNTRNSAELVGKCGVFKASGSERILFNNNLLNIRFSDGVLAEIVANWFRSSLGRRDLELATSATTSVAAIYQKSLFKLEIPLPPLAEQTVIAQTLDTLLAQVDNIKTRLDAIPKILKTFRQSVLAAAVSGKLTEVWRGENDGYRSASLNGGCWDDLPKNWQLKVYKEVVDSRLGKMLDKSKNTGVPTKYLGNINVRWFSIDLEKTQEILVSDQEASELNLKINDVLICEGGEPGRCAIWNMNQPETIIFQKALHRARVSKELIPKWLIYNLKNDADSLFLEQFFTGTTIKHLTGKALAKYPLRIPPVEEQTEIVRRVEELFAFADQIEQQVQTAQGRVNNLTQSILAKAFRGELTAQWRAENPELITGENSAEALLTKIQAERDALKKSSKPKKVTKKKSTRKKSDA